MNKGNSKTSERHKLVLNPPQRLSLKSSDKYIPFKTYLFITPGKI